MKTTKTKIIGYLKNPKLIGTLIAVFWFAMWSSAFIGPPVGCTPDSCPNGPLAELSAENIKGGVTIVGVTGTYAPSCSSPSWYTVTNQNCSAWCPANGHGNSVNTAYGGICEGGSLIGYVYMSGGYKCLVNQATLYDTYKCLCTN